MENWKKLFFLLMLILTLKIARGDKAYKIIKFKVTKDLWKQALRPTPVLKSPVTITLPINIDGLENNDVEEQIEDEETVTEEAIIVSNVTDVLQEEVPVLNSTLKPPEPQDPVVQNEEVIPLQDEEVQGQVIRFPCACREMNCGCCTGTILERIRMKACGNITFIPEDFMFDVRMSVNNNTVVRRRVSASDPPPVCFNPRRAPFVEVCAEISNIRIRNRNVNACLDINANIASFPIYSASFRCFSFGSSGIKTGLKPKKPASSGPKPVNLFGNTNNEGGGSFIENAASTVFGDSGIFGGGGSNNDGPFDGIGDALGDFLNGS